GDTAFRSARLVIADFINLKQEKTKNRFVIAIPLFAVGVLLTQINFTVIWRYFSWSNQTLATIMLWAAASYLVKENKNHWICTIPATFMTSVTTAYILQAKEGFKMAGGISNIIGITVAIILLILFIKKTISNKNNKSLSA
ncbi:MAG: carbon starvation protein A, partial [Peptostreptococcaceae bacterium]|nr:carbon starvation protein A [Peptostreptococcaceae bacterium]